MALKCFQPEWTRLIWVKSLKILQRWKKLLSNYCIVLTKSSRYISHWIWNVAVITDWDIWRPVHLHSVYDTDWHLAPVYTSVVVCLRGSYHHIRFATARALHQGRCTTHASCPLTEGCSVYLGSVYGVCKDRIHSGLLVVFVCLQITPSHYHYADSSEGIELIKCCQVYAVECV